jgi:hypothetical protein
MTELSDRIIGVRALAEVLWFLPPPGRKMIADKLYGLGVRVHPELATLALEREGPKELGNHAPMRVVKKASINEDMDKLRAMNPELAARIDAAQADPAMKQRIVAAKTPEERDFIAKAMGINIAQDLEAVNKLIGDAVPGAPE